MKYEISQQQYVDFLNTLNFNQQVTRTNLNATQLATNPVVFRSSTHGVFPRLGVTASNQKKLRDVGSVRDILYIIDTIKLLSEDLIGETRVQSVQNIDSRLRFFLNGLIRKQIIKTFSLRVYHEGHNVVINLDLILFSSIESVTVAIDLGKQEESYE
jgi:hypothetical protein